METLQSRVGSFSLLNKYFKKVKSSVEKSRKKILRDSTYKLNLSEKDILILSEQILGGTFKFSKLTPQEIKKQNKKGSYRGLLIPKPVDRIVHKALLKILFPYYEAYIKQSPSYGVLKGRGVQKAFIDLKKYLDAGYSYVLVADIQKFFNKIDRGLLEKEIFKFLDDTTVNDLISGVLKVQFRFNPKNASLFPDENNGIPQGCSLSPLFSDVFLKKFDTEMSKFGYVLFRYIDDFIILCNSKKEMYNGYRKAKKILKEIGLNVDSYNKEKCQAMSLKEKPNFLGVSLGPNSHFEPSKKKYNLFKQKLGNIAIRLTNSKLREETIDKVNGMIAGWCGAYKMCDKIVLEKCYTELNLLVSNLISKFYKSKKITQTEFIRINSKLLKFKN